MIVLTQKCPKSEVQQIDFVIPLTAEQRQKVKQRLELENQPVIHFDLPRGTHIHVDNCFQTSDRQITVQITAKPENVLTVRSSNDLLLLKAAYHLGNRHVPLEVQRDYLRFAPDHVLAEMLMHLGVEITEEIVPFFPEEGAYGHHH